MSGTNLATAGWEICVCVCAPVKCCFSCHKGGLVVLLQGALRCGCLCADMRPETQPLCLIACVCDAGLARLFGISSRKHLPSLRATLPLLPRTLPRLSSWKARTTSSSRRHGNSLRAILPRWLRTLTKQRCCSLCWRSTAGRGG